MSEDSDFRAAQEYFGFAQPAPVEKDWHVIRAMQAICTINDDRYALVFAGGTCLARAHRLIARMSEDVDFKIVKREQDSTSKSKQRKELGELRDKITVRLQEAGFAIDAKDVSQLHSRDDNKYTIYQLHYDPQAANRILRPTIQVELNYTSLRMPTVPLPVASFVSQAFNRPPEIQNIACASIDETAAEKLVSLTRRTAMEMAGAGRAPDPTLVRHIYDLHLILGHADSETVIKLAREIAVSDAEEFKTQHPAYAFDIAGETRKALTVLQSDVVIRERYASFVAAMVYGERPDFDNAMTTTTALVDAAWPLS